MDALRTWSSTGAPIMCSGPTRSFEKRIAKCSVCCAKSRDSTTCGCRTSSKAFAACSLPTAIERSSSPSRSMRSNSYASSTPGIYNASSRYEPSSSRSGSLWSATRSRHEREEVKSLLTNAPAVVITGGHVAVLLNRLRLFGMKELLDGKTLIAWSAGAMVLTERVVLFHDHPPQGPGNPEVVEEGLGLCPGIVALPDGRKRLDLEERHGVASFARRFLPDYCIVMGDGDCISWDGKAWSAHDEVQRLANRRRGGDGDIVVTREQETDYRAQARDP